MLHDYFYGEQANLFSFYRLPKVLFTDRKFQKVSIEAKVLYGLLLDRMGLSIKNGWLDEDSRVYIIFTTEEIMEALYCADNKATKLLKELEGVSAPRNSVLVKPGLPVRKSFHGVAVYF